VGVISSLKTAGGGREPTKHCFDSAGRERGEMEYNGGAELVQGTPVHVRNYRNEIPLH
jgi:hypothetical protein